MIDQTVIVGPFQCNCRILVCPETGEAALVDPGDEPQKIIQALEKIQTTLPHPLQVKYLFHTHAHLDHIGGTRDVKTHLTLQKQSPRIALHREDQPLYQALKMQGQMFGFDYEDPLPIEHFLEHEQDLKVGNLKFSVIHTPGHSPGSVCLRLHEDSALRVPESIFSGDTLFQGSVGRTDLWGADQDAMFTNIRERLFSLDDDTRVCPGHGPETSIGHEKRENPFF